jgi:hypothetical protein
MSLVQKYIGRVQRVPHFHKVKGKVFNIAHIFRKQWLSKIHNNTDVYFIYGELSSVDGIIQAANNPYVTINLVFGKTISKNENKPILEDILENNANRIKLFSIETRPPYHGFLIGKNLLYEDIHKPDERYHYATIIEDANSETIQEFLDQFFNLTEGFEPLSIEQLRQIPVGLSNV